jgi:serralysin
MAFIRGTNRKEKLAGTAHKDLILGYGGDDMLIGKAGNDTLKGGTGKDTLKGGPGDDKLLGQLGDDTLLGNGGNDTLNGGKGNDLLEGGVGGDAHVGGDGIDTVSYEHSGLGAEMSLATNSGSFGDAIGDTFFEIENIRGSNHDDQLYGDDDANVIEGLDGTDTLKGAGGTDTLYGGLGDDFLHGEAGGDAHYGGDGTDTVSYQGSTSGVGMDLLNNLGNVGDAIGDTFFSIENITGTNQDDGGFAIGGAGLYGNNADNLIVGLNGNDTLWGGGGTDTLNGGDGRDYLDGGTGADTIYCGTNDNDQDRVYLHIDAPDVINDWDFLDLDKLVIDTSETGISVLTSGNNFFSGNGPANNTHGVGGLQIIYTDNVNHTLYYDVDGAGGATPVLIASGFTQILAIGDFEYVA